MIPPMSFGYNKDVLDMKLTGKEITDLIKGKESVREIHEIVKEYILNKIDNERLSYGEYNDNTVMLFVNKI